MNATTPTDSTEASKASQSDGFAIRVGQSAKRIATSVIPISGGASALLFGVTMFLAIFGVVMVFAASSVEARQGGGSFISAFMRQGLFTVLGIPMLLLAARMPERFYRRFAIWGVLLGMGLQLLVFTPLGEEIQGNRNWLNLGFATLQPSEFLKLALCLWIGYVLFMKSDRIRQFLHAWWPVGLVAGVAIVLVVLGRDFGTVVIMVGLVFGAMMFAGVRLRHLIAPFAVLAVLAIPVVLSSGSRVRRLQHFFDGCTEAEYFDGCWQQLHGTWAMSGGGLFGVGLGNSRAKWNWLPEADSDYIFAIVAEELGMIGATAVLLLYVVMAFAFIRIIREAQSTFTKSVAGAVMTWIVGQALVNIAVVLGLLPVLGVPLPLVSAGGSQTLATLIAVGVVLALVRADRQRQQDGEKPEDVILSVQAKGRA
ncbi:MAG: peptidoglycan glycosyltransferase FtsW [Agrococcus casei]|uniref:peptidoglycan glycosyltransferase FtsW n=1 Tax=Agrococcus casei TaxID=343512 RepID=UPI003F9E0967